MMGSRSLAPPGKDSGGRCSAQKGEQSPNDDGPKALSES